MNKLICFWLCGILGAVLYAGPKIEQRHRNKDYDYRLLIPRKWKSIPTQPTEKYTVDKFQSYIRNQGFLPELDILVFNTSKRVVTENAGITFGKAGDAPEIGSDEWKKEFEKRWEEQNRYTNFDDYLAKELIPYMGAKLNKRYEIPWKQGKYKCAQVYEIGFTGRNSIFLELACAYKTGNAEFVVKYQIPQKDLKQDKQEYLDSFSSFKLGPKATGKKKKFVDITKLPPEKRRKAARKSLPKGWWASDTKNYIILTNVKKKKLVKEIATHLELIRAKYEQLFPPKKKIKAVSVVRLCSSLDEYHGYGGPPGSAGYFSSYSKELVIYDDSKQNKKNTFSVLYHECFHQYTYYFFGELSPHRWYGEGLGDYFAGGTFKNGSLTIKKFDWRSETIRKAVAANKHYHIKEFVKMPRSKYYGDADTCYAQGWAFIFFLKHTPKKRWQEIINIYIETLAQTKDKEKAVDKAFEGVDYEKINKAFVNFVKAGFKIK